MPARHNGPQVKGVDMESKDLDRLRAELAEIQEQLLELPRDAFAERYELRVRQDRLRDEAAGFHQNRDEHRPSAELVAELAQLRNRHRQVIRSRINLVGQSSGGEGAGPGAGAQGADGINRGIAAAQGAAEIEARIARIESILSDREAGAPS